MAASRPRPTGGPVTPAATRSSPVISRRRWRTSSSQRRAAGSAAESNAPARATVSGRSARARRHKSTSLGPAARSAASAGARSTAATTASRSPAGNSSASSRAARSGAGDSVDAKAASGRRHRASHDVGPSRKGRVHRHPTQPVFQCQQSGRQRLREQQAELGADPRRSDRVEVRDRVAASPAVCGSATNPSRAEYRARRSSRVGSSTKDPSCSTRSTPARIVDARRGPRSASRPRAAPRSR